MPSSKNPISPRCRFQIFRYSLGLGALGSDVKEAMPVLGEMITLYGSMVWLPTDGNNTPDFFTPVNAKGEIPIYTGFNVTLDGPFNEYLTLDTTDNKGVSIADMYRMIFSSAKERVKMFKGVVAITIWGVLDGLASSGIKKSPLADANLPPGASIMDAARQGPGWHPTRIWGIRGIRW